jgi:trimeric autotransporter adhesin
LVNVSAAGATGKNAGSYTNTVTAGLETNYTVTTANGSLDIAKANLVLSGTRVYDASQTFASQYLTATGVNSETFTVTGSGDVTNLNTKNVQTNQKLSSVTGLSLSDNNNGALNSNYNAISAADSSVSVTAKNATITGTTTNLTYNGASQSQNGAVLVGFVDADVTSGTVSATGVATGRNAGTYASKLSATGTDKDNYNITVTNANLVVGKKDASITGTTTNLTYNGTSQTQNAAVLASFVDSDVSNGTVGATGLATGRNAGTYASNLSVTGAGASNYNVIVTNKDLVIDKKSISLSGITAANKTYDGNTTATITAGAIATGVSTETLAVSGTGTFSDKNAADGKTVTVADVTTLDKTNGTGDWRNYNLTSTGSITTTANIDKKNVTLDSITAGNKVYDGTDTATITAGSITTGVGNETLAISGKGKFADTAPGTNKVVTVADVTTLTKTNGTGDWNNYKLNNASSKTTKATITAVQPSPPAPTPSPASTSSGSAAPRVKIPLGSGNPFQLASVEMLVEDVCSSSNLESCFCEASSVSTDVSICYEKNSNK